MLEVTKNAPQMAIIQLGLAFKNFFAKRSCYPKFRKKWIHDRLTLTNDQFQVNASRIRIPHLGWVRMGESLRFIGKIIFETISRVADKWFVSITVDSPKKNSNCIRNRDVNVAKNLEKLAVSLTVTACGASSNGTIALAIVSYAALKQEFNTKSTLSGFG